MAKRFCGNGFALVKAATRFSSSARTAIADIATAANHAATKPAASNPGLRRAFYQWQALVYPMTDNVHILRWGDSLLTGTGVKNGIVTHSDGLEVTDWSGPQN